MVKCKRHGTENQDNALHCQECGEKIEPKKAKKGLNKFILIGLGILGSIVLTVVVLILTSTPGVTKFDRALIKDVNNDVSVDSLITAIK